jgi:hypothetical protein
MHKHIPYLVLMTKVCYEGSPDSVSFAKSLLSLQAELMAVLKVSSETVLHTHTHTYMQLINSVFMGKLCFTRSSCKRKR